MKKVVTLPWRDMWLRLMVILIVLAHCISVSDCVVATYLPYLSKGVCSVNECIKQYFQCGFSNLEILTVLLHGSVLSLRHLKRILKGLGLKRRRTGQNITIWEDTVMAILTEMENSGECLGYWAIWQRLVLDHGVQIPRDCVMKIMRIIDPEGVARRKARRLQRRKYACPGPNFVWRVDGYDKLKPFGFAIHGCIDGFSRRILWLEVASRSNNPAIISTSYLDTLEHLGTGPLYVRCDFGTENSKLRLLQSFFLYNERTPETSLRSVIYGKSTSNQRIESWWSVLREQGCQWWINLFKDMRSCNLFQDGNPFHTECLKFCFMDVIQAELDKMARQWNLHVINKYRTCALPCGKPDIMFFTPELFGSRNYGKIIDVQDVQICMKLYGTKVHQ